MHPTRAASLLAALGAVLIAAALLLRALSLGEAYAETALEAVDAELFLPALGGYVVSPDGRTIHFIQAPPSAPRTSVSWYSMAADGGKPVSGTAPTRDLRPFRVSAGEAFVVEGSLQQRVSPASEQVMEARLAPNGTALAFTTRTGSGSWRLYILHEDARLDWLGEEETLYDLDWSPDGQALAFVAVRARVDQVITASTDGQQYRQLTSDPTRKSRPRWSPDGATIAYLAVEGGYTPTIGLATPTAPAVILAPTLTPGPGAEPPTPSRTDIYLIGADGADPRRLTDTPETEMALSWLQTRGGPELAFAARLPEHPQVAYLYAIAPDTGRAANTGALRRVYPTTAFDALECPAQIAVGERAAARITVSNSALVPQDVLLVLRARGAPFQPAEDIETDAARRETITLLPGETRVLEWEVEPSADRTTYISVVAGTTPPMPVHERSCAAPNTYFGLPALPFTALTLPLLLFGMFLCVPRLLQLRRRLFWFLWAAVLVAFWGMFIFESTLG